MVLHHFPLSREMGHMIDTVVKLLPALLGITTGHLLRLGGIAERRDADFTFRLIINILLPALAFTALSQVSIDRTDAAASGELVGVSGESLHHRQEQALRVLREFTDVVRE
jgi:hypothetical protein